MKSKIIFSFLSFSVAIFVLFISLLATSQARALSEAKIAVSRKRLYFAEKIMPDHVFYPLVAAGQKINLATINSPEEKVDKICSLVDQSLQQAEKLAEDGEYDMAMMVIAKSEQSLFIAPHLLAESDNGSENNQLLLDTLLKHHYTLNKLRNSFPQEHHSLMDEQIRQLESLIFEMKQGS